MVRDRSENGLTNNSPFIEGMPCPPAVHGDVVLDAFDVEVLGDLMGDEEPFCDTGEVCDENIFLINALEIVGDWIGDEDGLCESFEACVYSPNFGART